MHSDRSANLLGATALAVHDLMLAAVRRAAPVGASGAGALVVLASSPGIRVGELGRQVGLTQSAAVRMVDSLVAAGLVRRSPGTGRSVGVDLTPSGRRAVAGILDARARSLSDLLADLDAGQREVLDGLLSALLARLYGEVGDADLLCRLCDRACCTSGAVCPVGQAERDRRS